MNEESINRSKVFPNNFNLSQTNNVHFKILVPAISAGAIIGKGGESINQMQKETGTKVKISKSNDFYPGTKERVCLIIGTVEGIISIHSYIMNKIIDKLERNFSQHNQDFKNLNERRRQVKILVPNSTAGLIIGKSGTFIKDIKESTGAFVQISQKAREVNLLERCIVVAGESEDIRAALKIILIKLSQDPQSKICPNISYVDICGPVPSAFPTGSPYATVNINPGKKIVPGLPQLFNVHLPSWSPVSFCNNNAMQHTLPFGTSSSMMSPLYISQPIPSISNEFSQFSWQRDQNNLRTTLRQIGYFDNSINEIISALQTLDKYGILGKPRSLSDTFTDSRCSLSNEWLTRDKLVGQQKLNKNEMNPPLFMPGNVNSCYLMPSVNELSKNLNFYPNYRTMNPPATNPAFRLIPMPVQISPVHGPPVICHVDLDMSDCTLGSIELAQVERKYQVKIDISGRRLTVVGNDGSVSQALQIIRESVGRATVSQKTIDLVSMYQTPGGPDNVDKSDFN